MENEKASKIKNIIKIASVVIIIAAAVIIYNSFGFGRGNLRNIYSGENVSAKQMVRMGKDFVVISYDGARLVSESGEVLQNIENQMSSPHISTYGDYLLMYDKDGYKIALYRSMKKVYEYECDRRLKTARVNKNGYAVIVSDETGYNARISVLTPKGKVEYIWKIGDVYVVDADLAPDNQRIAAAAVSTDTGVVTETIIFADTYKEEEISRVMHEGSVPIRVKCTETGGAVVISDDRLCGYNSSGNLKWTADYESRLLSSFDIEDNGNTVLALSGIKNNTIVQTYTKNGSKSGEYITESEVKHIDAKGKYIALFEPSRVSVITFSGRLAEEYKTQKDFKSILMLSRKKILLMGTDGIHLLKI